MIIIISCGVAIAIGLIAWHKHKQKKIQEEKKRVMLHRLQILIHSNPKTNPSTSKKNENKAIKKL
ncbi:hypothetical protein [Metasolibacillus meyeri]|uniref:hypothetical protein n=1 Tax=Metasolibacillus meyeri TaxID=1071052 RepID=UPI000D31E0D3|nr:hypothetical protein [Metasolibacillus meyeri]